MNDAKSTGRWMSYAAAAGVAASMVGTEEADAAVVYSGVLNIPILNDTLTLSTSLGAVFGTLIHNTLFSSVFIGEARAAGSFGNNGQVVGAFGNAYNLAFGQPLTVGLSFLPVGASGLMAYSNSGPFTPPGFGFLGFQFDVGNGPQFAWARVDMSGASLNEIVLVDFAYATFGEFFSVGQTEVIPEPSSLGLLAVGAAGLLAARAARRRKAEAKAEQAEAAA